MGKNIIKQALLEAEELERAALENAKDVLIEAFTPDLLDLFKKKLNEEEEFDVDDENIPVDDSEDEEEPMEDEPVKEGTEHDLGKEPDAGRDDTDASGEELEEYATVTEAEEEDEEGDSEDETPEPEEDAEEEEFEIPDELFDDEEEEAEEDMDEEDDVVMDTDDEEEPEGDSEEDDSEESEDVEEDEEFDDVEDDEELDIDIDDEDEEMEEPEEEYDEGLYMRKEGQFVKVSPEDALNYRKSELEEENERLTGALTALRGQIAEANTFNAKLAYTNKLYNSGLFNTSEKESIVERMDECESVDEVKHLYSKIVKEVKTNNPLDNFSKTIKEAKTVSKTKSENIFESTEVLRMKKMAGIL